MLTVERCFISALEDRFLGVFSTQGCRFEVDADDFDFVAVMAGVVTTDFTNRESLVCRDCPKRVTEGEEGREAVVRVLSVVVTSVSITDPLI